MTVSEALRLEIENTPEPILRETYDFLLFLKQREAGREAPSTVPPETKPMVWPDFMAQLKEIYGDRILPDSQEIMDYIREERCL